jgi:hypothetical protein
VPDAVDYTPRQLDIDWFNSMVSLIRDGGVWICPCNTSTYRFEHSSKQLVLLTGDPEEETNRRTAQVAEAYGWSVKEDTSDADNDRT